MQNALGVRGIQCIGDLRGDLEHQAHVERPPRQLAVERFTIEQLHGQVELALVLIEAVDGADVGVVQGRGGACFALESLDRLLVVAAAGRQHLERDLASKLEVLGAVHDAHATGSKPVDDAVVPECLADEGVRHGAGRSSYACNALTGKGVNATVKNLKRRSV